MSYDIVKSIAIKNNEVFITSASNNVTPRHYTRHKANNLTRLLNEKGKRALEIELLKAYESGSFQQGTENKYSRAAAVLRGMDEYKAFDWRQNGEGYAKARELRETKAFGDLIAKALEQKPKPCIVVWNRWDRVYYLCKVNKRGNKFSPYQSSAKIFHSEAVAKDAISNSTARDQFAIIKQG